MKIKYSNNQTLKLFSDLIASKSFLGYSKSMWDPTIYPYLLGVRNGFCIFNIDQTLINLQKVLKIISKINFSKKTILFVGFPEFEKKQLLNCVKIKNHFYASNYSWVNGIFTNWKDLYVYKNNFFKDFKLKKEKEKRFFYEKFSGILNLNKKPDLIIIFDHANSLDALHEALKTNIPVISFINSGSNPQKVDYPITGNFTTVKGGKFYYNLIKYSLN
jgi:small subunit ribosomal protein S2